MISHNYIEMPTVAFYLLLNFKQTLKSKFWEII